MYEQPTSAQSGAQLLAGDDIGNFRITALVESTRYGNLLRARDAANGDNYYVFVFPRFDDPENSQRVEAAALALGRFKAPGLLKVGSLAEDNKGNKFLPVGPVRTPTIEERLRGGSLSPTEARQVLVAVGKTVVTAHELGLVHGSLTPAKIHWSEELGAEIFGFGWNQIFRDKLDPILSDAVASKAGKLATGDLEFSKEEYAKFWSPEWHGRLELEGRTDQYSLGALAYYLVTGAKDISDQKVSQPLPILGVAWRGFLRKTMSSQPKNRFFSSELMLKQMEALPVKGSSGGGSAWLWMAAGLVVVGGIGAVYFLKDGPQPAATVPAPVTAPKNVSASWTIVSMPAGATLSVDGKSVGVTPYTVEGLILGSKHAAALSLDPYRDEQIEVVLGEAKQVSEIKLVPAPAKPEAVAQEPATLSLPLGGGGKSIEFVKVPPGKLIVGRGGMKERTVGLADTIYVAVTELTQEQLAALGTFENNSSLNWRYRPGIPANAKYATFPVNRVSFADVVKIVETVRGATRNSDLSAFLPDLPTESEWEYLARAGAEEDTLAAGLLSDSAIDLATPEAVGGRKANAFGLYGMLGNVSEWCHLEANTERSLKYAQAAVRGGYWAGGATAAQPGTRVVSSTTSVQTAQLERCGLRLILRKKTP